MHVKKPQTGAGSAEAFPPAPIKIEGGHLTKVPQLLTSRAVQFCIHGCPDFDTAPVEVLSDPGTFSAILAALIRQKPTRSPRSGQDRSRHPCF
jgi:hypothetical protein